MTIDFTKPVQTRDGQPVTILTTKREHALYPVVGMVNDEEVLVFTAEGCLFDDGMEDDMDLVNVPVKQEFWINIYHNEHGGCPWVRPYQTKEEADYKAAPERIACVRIEYEIGDGL